jgi:hypothetical protein
MKSERFNPPEIIRDPSAQVKHFKPEENGRDRFGNKFLSSPNLAYLDGSKDKVKAGMLISLEGQSFIQKNPKILQDIERGLAILEKPHEGVPETVIDLGGGRAIEKVTSGGQSNFYILTINEERYAIKTHVSIRDGRGDMHQPYINEMLQTQSMAEDLKVPLKHLRVEMAKFLFASGQVSCTLFEEGAKNLEALDPKRLEVLERVAKIYIAKQHENHNPLWEQIFVDGPLVGDKNVAPTALNNFKVRADGTMVWIDPFIYVRKDPLAGA